MPNWRVWKDKLHRWSRPTECTEAICKLESRRDTIEKFAKLGSNNAEQIEKIVEQNHRIEEFLDEVVNMLRSNQKTSIDLNQKLIAAEGDISLYKKELADLFKDFEGRYEYFQQVTQTDAANMLKLQKESNKNLESFVTMVNKRTTVIEDTLKERLDSYHSLIQQISKRELEDECFKPLIDQLAAVQEKIGNSEKKFQALDVRVSNFRNEINTLFLDYETDMNNRWTEVSNAIGSLAKQTGSMNPLLV